MTLWASIRKKIIDFLDELGLFNQEKRFFTKKNPSTCRLPSVKQYSQPPGRFFQPRITFN
jgi:hypothetical protein